jgi:hypothetical protein
VVQEREDSSKSTKFIEHSTSWQQFLMNTFSMHSPHRIAERLPPALRGPISASTPDERRAVRSALACGVREARQQKKEATAAKKTAAAAAAAAAAEQNKTGQEEDGDQIMSGPSGEQGNKFNSSHRAF